MLANRNTLSDIITELKGVGLPGFKKLFSLPNGLVFVVDTRDNLEEDYNLADGQGHDPHVIAKMIEFIQENQTYVEVGAHYGDFLLQMSQKIGPNGRIYGFEPNKNLFKHASVSIFLNNISSIMLENLAVLDTKQEVAFIENVEVSLMSSIASNNDVYTQKVMATTLDAYFESKETIVDAIRIDAEGSECRILRGAKNIIDSSPDIKLFIEWQTPLLAKYETEVSMQECLSNLLDKGFIFLNILKFNKNCHYTSCQLSINNILGSEVIEFLAIREESLKKLIVGDYSDQTTAECLACPNDILYRSTMKNSSEEVRNIIVKANINHIHPIGVTVLYMAAQDGYYDVVKVLLEAGADTEIEAKNNYSPLYASVVGNYTNIAKLLLDHGANIEFTFPSGSTPLFVSAYFGYDEMAKLLLDHGANKDVQVNGTSAFQIALINDHPSTAIILAGSQEQFCVQILNTEFETKYAGMCVEGHIEL